MGEGGLGDRPPIDHPHQLGSSLCRELLELHRLRQPLEVRDRGEACGPERPQLRCQRQVESCQVLDSQRRTLLQVEPHGVLQDSGRPARRRLLCQHRPVRREGFRRLSDDDPERSGLLSQERSRPDPCPGRQVRLRLLCPRPPRGGLGLRTFHVRWLRGDGGRKAGIFEILEGRSFEEGSFPGT